MIQGYEQTISDGILASQNTANSISARTPIQHIIIIMNENHGFDNFYGVYPGLPLNYNLNLSVCVPYKIEQKTKNPCEKPFNADNISAIQETDQCHTEECSVPDYNKGLMNGFVEYDTKRSMAYYDGKGVPQLWDLAQYFDLDYNFYSSALSYSESNHLFAVSADTPLYPYLHGNHDRFSDEFLNFTYPEIGTEMTKAGISWGYYQYFWNDKVDCTGNYNTEKGLFDGPGVSYWEGEAQFRKVQNRPIECSSLGNMTDFENALATNTLPQVSWVEPSTPDSCHPGLGTLQACQQYTTSLINDIEQSPVWNSSVTFLTYDEYGGYYDNVAPTKIDEFGDGFREPLIAISPFTIQGLVGGCGQNKSVDCAPKYDFYNNYSGNHGVTTREDFSAFLSTIEYNWRLNNLTDTDGEEPNLFYMLNFSQTPLKPLFFNSNYSLAAYPLSACYNGGGCQIGQPFYATAKMLGSSWLSVSVGGTGASARTYSVYNAPIPSWAEPVSESAAYSCGVASSSCDIS
jgi:phospholipase C